MTNVKVAVGGFQREIRIARKARIGNEISKIVIHIARARVKGSNPKGAKKSMAGNGYAK
jgi:hypothetical protein